MPLGIQQMACSDITRWNYRPVRYKACYFSVIIIIQNKGVSITLLFLFCFFAFFVLKDVGFSLSFLLNEKEKKPFFILTMMLKTKKNSRNGRCLSFFFSLKFWDNYHSFLCIAFTSCPTQIKANLFQEIYFSATSWFS